MIRFRTLVFLEKKVFCTVVINRHKSKQSAFKTCNVSEPRNQYKETDSEKHIPMIRKLAVEHNLKLNDFLIERQDEDEVECIFQEIAQGDAELEKRLRLILYEIELHREEEKAVPAKLKKEHWEKLLKLPSVMTRAKFLRFLFLKEKKKESDKIKDTLRREEAQVFKELREQVPHVYYGLNGWAMFLRIYQMHLMAVPHIRALTNKLFAPPVVFDCSYQTYMNDFNSKYCAKQIAQSCQINRLHPNPCSIQLVNLNKEDLLMKYLELFIPKISSHEAPLEISEKSYLDLYPKERLVYLTPHTNELLNARPDDIYIIGAFVDKGMGTQVSLAKAKEDGLRMAKLPLDKYLLWRKGTKSLTLNHMLNILLDLRYYKNWRKALEVIPSRNLT